MTKKNPNSSCCEIKVKIRYSMLYLKKSLKTTGLYLGCRKTGYLSMLPHHTFYYLLNDLPGNIYTILLYIFKIYIPIKFSYHTYGLSARAKPTIVLVIIRSLIRLSLLVAQLYLQYFFTWPLKHYKNECNVAKIHLLLAYSVY